MSTRLTNELRRRISKAVLKHRFAADDQNIEEARPIVGEAVYEVLYPTGSEERKHLEASLEGEHYRTKRKTCHFPGNRWVEIEFPKVLPFFDKHANPISFDANSDATSIYESYLAAERAVGEAKEEAGVKVWALLEQATTVKKLLEIWPEVEPFIPVDAAPTTRLPAVPVDEVNALLGLKKE